MNGPQPYDPAAPMTVRRWLAGYANALAGVQNAEHLRCLLNSEETAWARARFTGAAQQQLKAMIIDAIAKWSPALAAQLPAPRSESRR